MVTRWSSAVKSSRSGKISVRLYFIFIIFGIILLTVSLAAALLIMLQGSFEPLVIESVTLVSILFTSIVLGAAITAVASIFVSRPFRRLTGAMGKVAAGDFSVRLEENSSIKEIREAYSSFNLMTRELQSMDAMQSDFVSNVSHEFKTPIAAINGYAMLLQDCPEDPQEQQELLDKIVFNTQRLSELVSNMLLLSKLDSSAIADVRDSFRLDEQIRKAILALEHRWAKKNIDFDVDLKPVTITGNENLLMHVWINLIDNAIKYSGESGLIKVRLTGGRKIVAIVEDNGCGIPAESLPYIFERFYQVDASHRTEGNGLGLALVKKILDSCGGEIYAESHPGRGARFTVALPGS